MLQYMRYTVEFEVSFVKPSMNTLSFTGQFKYQFSVFNYFFFYLTVQLHLVSITDLNFVK